MLGNVSPLSLRIIFEQIKRAPYGNLRDAFITDFRIAQRYTAFSLSSLIETRCMEDSEFFEGVRCLLVDRKDKPKWKYAKSE